MFYSLCKRRRLFSLGKTLGFTGNINLVGKTIRIYQHEEDCCLVFVCTGNLNKKAARSDGPVKYWSSEDIVVLLFL